jgi:hypothetical protein
VATRWVNTCNSQHWQSLRPCYPGPSPGTACSCGLSQLASGCSDYTCWSKEGSWRSYTSSPSTGSFFEIYHCFGESSGWGNSYKKTPCASPGDPASLGWIATQSTGEATSPIYLCQWTASSVTEHFLTTVRSECVSVGGTLVGDPWGYAVPY